MTWTKEAILQRLADFREIGRDATGIEVKRASHLPKNLPETVCAFANMPEGGTIILGVAEEYNFAVIGLDDPNKMFNEVVSQIRNAVVPAPQLMHEIFDIDGKSVLVIEVIPLPLSQRPARYGGKAYLRQSDGDYVMNDSDYALIEIQKASHTEQYRFDVVPVTNSAVDDLDQGLVDRYLKDVRAKSKRLAQIEDDDVLLRTCNIQTEDGQLTLAGLYALGYYPQAKAPQLRITAAVENPANAQGIRTRNRKDFDGPLPDLLEDVLAWVKENTPRQNRYLSDGNMREESVYPLPAVRELLANALVHRDLSPNTEGKWVEVRVRADRLVIVNPGGLRGVSTEQLKSATLTKNAVNPRLYDMAKHVTSASGNNVIEGEGAGVREVFKQVRDAGLPEPSFQDTGVQFTVILYASKSNFKRGSESGVEALEREETSKLTLESATLPSAERVPEVVLLENFGRAIRKNAYALLAAFRNAPDGMSVSELVESSGLSVGQVRYVLNKLLAVGIVQRDGGWGVKTTKYSVEPWAREGLWNK
ncbi:ATP-binding protein [Arcanobacterium bovis]|uniref:Transcriptional regulator n=1 Tax=Arcanobacterium bovis TaxID=2529275 RepID=A0A4Q9V2B4_9ACTO|nr:ATP-binding protein [Arcanobacterium bovis]TBW23785.1 transcriptional regulator [Arcanobacterium bovis]